MECISPFVRQIPRRQRVECVSPFVRQIPRRLRVECVSPIADGTAADDFPAGRESVNGTAYEV